MKIYHHPFSSSSFKVRAVLSELSIPAQLIEVDLAKGAHKTPDYITKNPFGRVPLLEEDGFFLWESNAICEYLAAKTPNSGLLPNDPRGRALVTQWLQWQAMHLGTAVHKVMWETFYAGVMGHTPDPAALAKGYEETKKELAGLERALAGKEYVLGKLSVVDFSLATTLILHDKIGINLKPFPNVAAWMERMEARASLKACLPPM